MSNAGSTRRDFIRSSIALAGAAAIAPGLSRAGAGAATTQGAGGKRTAVDQVQLGQTGIMMSRLGVGTGSMGGHSQAELGKEGFINLVHYCFDQGITYLDCAQAYQTFKWMGDAIKGLPREKLFIQSKIPGQPKDVLATIDNHRKTFNTDYFDTMLIHCMVKPGWTEDWKHIMDGFNEAKEKKWIRAKGVSCHTLPALQAANKSDFNEVHLVRVNPMGAFMDVVDSKDHWGETAPVDPVLKEIEEMHKKGRGIIGMKICGNGTFTKPEDREKSIKFAMNNPNIDAVVIGMKRKEEVDENIKMINAALAAA